jgi:xanthine dehydrogenase molybdopterin-binding subunit B
MRTTSSWARRTPAAVAVVVDFEAEMVLVAAHGSHPTRGRIMVIDSVTETKNEVVVHVRTRAGGHGCVAGQSFSHPTVAVAAPARPKPVRFVDRIQFIDCLGGRRGGWSG